MDFLELMQTLKIDFDQTTEREEMDVTTFGETSKKMLGWAVWKITVHSAWGDMEIEGSTKDEVEAKAMAALMTGGWV